MDGMSFAVSVDLEADAAYIRLLNHAIARTVLIGEGVNVDLSALDVVVGIEMLTIDSKIPFARLTTEYHVPVDAVARLRNLMPSIQESVMRQSSDGTLMGRVVGRLPAEV